MEKSLGQVLYESLGWATKNPYAAHSWHEQIPGIRDEYDRVAAAVIAEHERRKPQHPTGRLKPISITWSQAAVDALIENLTAHERRAQSPPIPPAERIAEIAAHLAEPEQYHVPRET